MNRCTGSLVVALSAVLASGCPRQGADDRTKVAKGQAKWSDFNKKSSSAAGEKGDSKPAPPKRKEIPKVNLTKDEAATCRINVADAMPEGELPGLDGKAAAIRSILGAKATVVLFWSTKNPLAAQALRRLGVDVLEPFGDKGVRVVTIDVKDQPEAARKAVQEAGPNSVNLLDAGGAYFAKVATSKLPRVYLLDSAGKIVWFDMEYSGVTRTSLKQAIEAVLEQKP